MVVILAAHRAVLCLTAARDVQPGSLGLLTLCPGVPVAPGA